MGKKRGEYKKYLYDSNMVMPKSTHYKKIKTCHQIPSNNENDDEQQSTSEINDQLKSDSLDIDKEKLITTGLYLVNKYCNKNHLKEIQVLEEEEDGSKMVLIFTLNFNT